MLQCNERHSSPPVRKYDTNKMDLSDYERRLFQSVTMLINIGIKQLFTEAGAVILRFQCHFGE